MPRSDLKNRKWRNPKAEQEWQKDQRSYRKQYWNRRSALVDVIVRTVAQKELNCYLEAPTLPMLLLRLKHEVDISGGFHARCPYPDCVGASTAEESMRAEFMKDAYDLALKSGKIKLDSQHGTLLLYVHNEPKWTLYRSDGRTIVDYIPTKAELTEYHTVDFDTEQELTFTGKIGALLRNWL